MTGEDQSRQSAHGLGIAQAYGPGAIATVNIGLSGGPNLTLYARHRLARTPKKPLDLLNPISRSIPMLGRDRELRQLVAWLDDGSGISARCLVGGAGSGK